MNAQVSDDGVLKKLTKNAALTYVACGNEWVTPEVRDALILLREEVLECRPTVVVTMSNLALWAFTGQQSTIKWRSSVLQCEIDGFKFKVIPTYSIPGVQRQYTLRPIFIHDLRRAGAEMDKGPEVIPVDYDFIIRPSYSQALAELYRIEWHLDNDPEPVDIAADIETRAGHTACIGLATSPTKAICIPWMCKERLTGYWTEEQEVTLVILLRRILSHPRANVIWQNGAYDHQYEYRWHFYIPRLAWDTMLAQHAMFSVSPKSLDHLSSLYCEDHRYWKDDGRLWDPSKDENDFWFYNCEDCVRTFVIKKGEEKAIAYLTQTDWPRLPEVVEFQHTIQPVIVRMMFRGVRSDDAARLKMRLALMQRTGEIQGEINDLLGKELNIRSPKQMVETFYGELNQRPIFRRNPDGTRGSMTCDDDALITIAAREPVLRPLIARIQAMRSAGVFLSTFVNMSRDTDGRLRCAYNVGGTKTYRLSSSESAFNSGGNLQNIPTGDDDEEMLIPLPNIRQLFLFDPGFTGFDLDGDSADLRIVTGESGCRAMQAYFAAKVKPYVEIAKEFYSNPTITKSHFSYKRMKALCHGSNYGGEARGLSERIGLPVHDIERMQKWYFGMCPEIKAWQEDIKAQGQSRGYIENPFGYRYYNWDRWTNQVANSFLAWTPQSTVGLLINKIAVELDKRRKEVQLLLQVHDSLTGQYPSHLGDGEKREILAIAESVPIPCRTGTIFIPAGMKTSQTNWGDCA